jgi:hypothetical protein
MWQARYKLRDGRWQTWAIFEEWLETKEAMEFHAQGREYEIISLDTIEKFKKEATCK